MRVIVHKYGGSSLSGSERVRAVAARVALAHRGGDAVVVVVSAQGDTTDTLLNAAEQVSPVRPPREVDQLLATGECASAALLAMALHGLGVPARSLTGGQAGILATGTHGNGSIAAVDTGPILRLLEAGQVVVVAGFQAVDANGETTTLGRGGSDTTAAALAAQLSADRCEIYTDVDGIRTADPRLVHSSRLLGDLDPVTTAELAYAGAKVLHPRAACVAGTAGVPLYVGSATAATPGTRMLAGDPDRADHLERRGAVVAVAHELDIAGVSIRLDTGDSGRLTRVLTALAEHEIPVDMLSLRDSMVGFTVKDADLVRTTAAALPELSTPEDLGVRSRLAKVSLVGTGLLNRTEYAARMLTALRDVGIQPGHVCASQARISVTVDRELAMPAVTAVHEAFTAEWPPAPSIPHQRSTSHE